VVCDPMIYPAVIACELEKIPWVALSNSLNPVLPQKIESELLDTMAWLSDDRERLFEGLEIRFRGCDALSPHLTIAFTTPEFTGNVIAGVEQVGPARALKRRGDETEFPWHRLESNKPIIFASFGSQIYHQPELFKNLMESVSGKSVQLVAAVYEMSLENVPDNVILTGYAPQLALLERAHIMITHGGANSVMESISANVPILINPICNDQFHQAWFLERSGCGRQVDLVEMSVAEIWSAITWALGVGPSEVFNSYQVDGSQRAAALISEL